MKNNNDINRMVRIFIDKELPNVFGNAEGIENIRDFAVASIEATARKVAKAPYIQGIGDLAYVMIPIANQLIGLMNRVDEVQFVFIVNESRLVNIKDVNEFNKFVGYMKMKYPDLSPDIKIINGDTIVIGGELKMIVPLTLSTI